MKTLVVGGGMSGLTYAILAAKNGDDVTVCERNARVGRKIAMSGNGKCNIANANTDPSCYNDSEIVRSVLAKVKLADYLRFLSEQGIVTYTDECGRMYPVTDSASTVVDCLRFQAAKFGVTIRTETVVRSVKQTSHGYVAEIDGNKENFDKVVVACGSRSQAVETEIGTLVDKKYLTPCAPSLVPMRVVGMNGILNGIRNRAEVRLVCDGKTVGSERGEIQFKDYGLSGMCVFNLSAIIARSVVRGEKHEYKFVVDLLPDITPNELQKYISANLARGMQPLTGLVKNKLAEYIYKQTNNDTEQIAHYSKNLPFIFDKLLDYSMSQVTAGGVDEKFVDKQTLALPDGVVVLGEALNVDGICGGHNLYFAAASAMYLFM